MFILFKNKTPGLKIRLNEKRTGGKTKNEEERSEEENPLEWTAKIHWLNVERKIESVKNTERRQVKNAAMDKKIEEEEEKRTWMKKKKRKSIRRKSEKREGI